MLILMLPRANKRILRKVPATPCVLDPCREQLGEPLALRRTRNRADEGCEAWHTCPDVDAGARLHLCEVAREYGASALVGCGDGLEAPLKVRVIPRLRLSSLVTPPRHRRVIDGGDRLAARAEPSRRVPRKAFGTDYKER